MEITLNPIAQVTNSRLEPTDDNWGNTISEITLLSHIPTEAFDHLEDFSHLEIIYYFDQVKKEDIVFSGHSRGNRAYPKMGIFGQRKKDRPNQLGLCTVELIGHSARSIQVKFLDAMNGTPILDIKPVFNEFKPKVETRQPAWVSDLMKNYW